MIDSTQLIIKRLLIIVLLGFGCLSTYGQWHIPNITGVTPNSVQPLGNDCFEMTDALSERGVVWDSVQVDLSQPFDIRLTISQTGAGFGADGLAFVLHNQASGLNSWGPGGHGHGVLNTNPPTAGYPPIVPSLAVEVDLQFNSFPINDIGNDHIAIHINGDNTTAVAGGPIAAVIPPADIDDGTCRVLRVVWTPAPTNRLEVFFDGVLKRTYNNDIVTSIFSGDNTVWWGFTASTGGAFSVQTICVDDNFASAGIDTSVCLGQSITLQGSGGVSHTWSPNGQLTGANTQNPVFTPAAAGNTDLEVIITNAAGCTDRDSVRVVTETPPTSDPGFPQVLCAGDTLILGAAANPALSYQWSPGASLSDPTATNPFAFPTNTTTYQLIVTDTTGLAMCMDTATVQLTVATLPIADAGPDDTVCVGSCVQIGGASSTGPSINYSWSPTTGLSDPSIAQPTACPSVTTTYFLLVDSAGMCPRLDSMTLVVNDTPTVQVTAAPDPICAGQSSTLDASPSGGTPAYTYAWSSGGNGQQEVVSPLGTSTFTVTVTDANNCMGTGSATVTVNVADSIGINVPDTFVCNNGSIDITGTFQTGGIDTWSWTPTTGVSDPSIPNPTITPTSSTTYFLSGSNSSTGCGYTDSIRIDVFQLVVNHWSDTTICLGDSLDFNIQPQGGSGNYSYLWMSSTSPVTNDTIANPSAGPQATGTYAVIVTDQTTDCSVTFTINVTVSQLQVTATPQVETINPGQRVQLEAFGAMFYSWAPDTAINCTSCQNPVVKPEMSITYTVTGWDTSGCMGTADVQIIVDSFQVQNVFTPNGDGINDVLMLNYYGEGFYEIQVYDRWGHQIFQTKDTNAIWDGNNANGEPVPEGVYYLVVRIGGDDAIPDKDKNRAFNVTLMR